MHQKIFCFCPIVCLKSNVQLEEKEYENGEKYYSIVKKEGSATDVFNNPETYYGQVVTGYEVGSESVRDAVDTWRIFHSDGDNIYLIADTYIKYSDAPNSANNAILRGNTDYCGKMTDVRNDYSSGSGAIEINNPARKWLSYIETEAGKTSTNSNMKVVAYMMDTNIWGSYAGSSAEYAIGGPTLEMFCASYNRTHKDKQMYSTAYSDNGYGYMIKWAKDIEYSTYIEGMATSDDYYNIYVIGTGYEQTAEGMWLASNSAHSAGSLMTADCDGYVYGNYSIRPHYGFRPIVCLKSNVELESNGSGGYKIKN